LSFQNSNDWFAVAGNCYCCHSKQGEFSLYYFKLGCSGAEQI